MHTKRQQYTLLSLSPCTGGWHLSKPHNVQGFHIRMQDHILEVDHCTRGLEGETPGAPVAVTVGAGMLLHHTGTQQYAST
jgi:hypothetical protein